MNKTDFLRKAVVEANASGHLYPEYAACEAALESAWGTSVLATECNNLFGEKEPHSRMLLNAAGVAYPVVSIPTHEWNDAKKMMVPATAQWPSFPDWRTCFLERMALLKRLAPAYPHYQAALSATTGEEFVTEVSASWSTDPLRGEKVLAIFNDNKTLLVGVVT